MRQVSVVVGRYNKNEKKNIFKQFLQIIISKICTWNQSVNTSIMISIGINVLKQRNLNENMANPRGFDHFI